MIERRSFGQTRDGQEAFLYVLKNKNGMEAHILDYGAALVRLFVPDREGKLDDIVLGYDSVSGYEVNESSQGVVVGRVANRIRGAQFTLNGRIYSLDKNDGENTLHSGYDRYGFHFYRVYFNIGFFQPLFELIGTCLTGILGDDHTANKKSFFLKNIN